MENLVEIPTEGQVARGVIHLPDRATQRLLSAIVIHHGYFYSNKIGPARLYVQLGRHLAAAGFACLRYDSRGVGDSDGDFEDLTYVSCVADGVNAIRYVQSVFGIELNRIGILGHSMGGNIAISVATRVQALRSLCLVAPDSKVATDRKGLLTPEALDLLYKKGTVERKGLVLKREFLEPILSNASFKESARVTCPVLLIQGTDDEFYDESDIRRLAARLPGSVEVKIIEKGDHNFLDPGARRVLLGTVEKWYRETLSVKED